MNLPVYMHVSESEFGPYPYRLRPDARSRYPDVMPCPTSWDKCTAEQRAAFNAVEVVRAAPPELQPGESVREVTPAFVDGVLTQQWEVMPPEPPEVPDQIYGHQMRAILMTTSYEDTTLWEKVLWLISQMPEPKRTIVDDTVRTAAIMRRDSETIEQLRIALGLTQGFVDQLFISGDQVEL